MKQKQHIRRYKSGKFKVINKGNRKPDIKEVLLKSPGVKVIIRRGDSKLYLIAPTKVYSYSLKMTGEHPPHLMGWDEVKRSVQYRRLTALGFITHNGRTYTHKDANVWLSMHYGKVFKLKEGNRLTNSVCFVPFPQKVRIVLGRGLTRDDRALRGWE